MCLKDIVLDPYAIRHIPLKALQGSVVHPRDRPFYKVHSLYILTHSRLAESALISLCHSDARLRTDIIASHAACALLPLTNFLAFHIYLIRLNLLRTLSFTISFVAAFIPNIHITMNVQSTDTLHTTRKRNNPGSIA